jgi:hypothetical protein
VPFRSKAQSELKGEKKRKLKHQKQKETRKQSVKWKKTVGKESYEHIIRDDGKCNAW